MVVNANNEDRYVIGVDYGTLSGRALVVRVSDGAEAGTAVHEYRHGVMDRELAATGEPLPPDWALQDPADYLAVLRIAVPAAVKAAGIDPAAVIGIATDFTACTVLPAAADGIPLCMIPGLEGRPHAYPKLWKHHAAQPHADRINALAHERKEPWIERYGGKISSEWQYAKALQLLEEDPELYGRADRWIEAADWIIWQLTGTETRNACTAGYKGIWQDGHYPSRDFLAALNPGFASFAADKLEHPISALGTRAGSLTAEAAEWTGLPGGIAVAVGNVDAHVTAPAARAVEPGQMVVIMGTSTCHVMNSDGLAEIPGMCGVVDGGIIAGQWGYEAGQSSVGDIFAWFTEHAVPGSYRDEAALRGISVHDLLTEEAAAQPAGEHGLVALDWFGGNRSVLVDHHLSGAIVGLTLATRPTEIYRALLESTAFGTRVIVESFGSAGVPMTDFIVAGGLLKNELLMQIYTDVLRRPLSVIGSDQGPALGSAIHAAVAAGAYPDVPAAVADQAKTAEERIQWSRQLADTLSAGVQSGKLPDGEKRLQALWENAQKDTDKNLAAYIKIRLLTADYARAISAPKDVDVAKIQADWLKNLEQYIADYPLSPDAAEAMLQLGIAREYAGQDDGAKKWYERIGREFADSPQAKKAAGAARRIDSVGTVLNLSGKGSGGETVDLASYRGKAVLVQYWATWSESAKNDMATLKQLAAKYRGSFDVIGVSVDSNVKTLKAYLAENPLPWQQIFEEGGQDSRPANALGIITVPTMILVDPQGKVVNRNIQTAEIEAELKKLLK